MKRGEACPPTSGSASNSNPPPGPTWPASSWRASTGSRRAWATCRWPSRCSCSSVISSAGGQQRHGHTLQQDSVREAVAGREALVPVFVRMEYLRGVILNLIEMWALIRESVTVQDAFIDWSQKIQQERKLKVILMTVPQ